MGYSNDLERQRNKQAHDTLKEINKLLEKFYSESPREELLKQIDDLKTENYELRKELDKYKKVVESIQLLQAKEDTVRMCVNCEYFENYSYEQNEEYDCSKVGFNDKEYYWSPRKLNECPYFSKKVRGV